MPISESNLLLDALSPDARQAILSRSKNVTLAARASMQAQEECPRFGYFLASGVASVVVTLFEGSPSETSLIGNEGVAGCLSILGKSLPTAECFMQIKGTAFQIPFERLHDLFSQNSEIHTLVLQSAQQQVMTTMQIAACNVTHESEARLARWLLMFQDRVGGHTFHLTQEFLSQMLGSRRTTVALAAGALKRSGLIEYSRGRVTMLCREDLEAAACTCYGITRRLLHDLYR